jgi:hypothetical protein
MRAFRFAAAMVVAFAAIGVSGAVGIGQQPPPPRLPLAPPARSGTTVTPALEGWFRNPDGTATIMIGYMNRNQQQVLDIPVGPENRIEPGGPDYLQPTHFDRGRGWGVFTITVPKDFGTKRLTWTLVSNGQTQAITLWLNEPYAIDPLSAADTGNTPPRVKVVADGPEFVGPPRAIGHTLTARVNEPLRLAIWATDRGNTIVASPPLPPLPTTAPAARGRGAAGRAGRGGASAPVTMRWAIHRRPGTAAVKFENATPAVTRDAEAVKLFPDPGTYTGTATTTVTFPEPGEYVLRAQVNDASGDGGEGKQCCWTNVLVRVTVK